MWSLLPTKHNFDLASYRCAKDVHPREVPLALLNELFIGDESYAAQYQGHGQTQIAFKLMSSSGGALDGCVLKVVCPSKLDPEVDTMHHLNKSDAGICVPILREGYVSTTDFPKLRAWICGYATPLNVFLTEERAVLERCMLGVLICILRAAESGCLISDVGFYNFGVVQGRVVIIDAGSRGVSDERFNKKTLTQAFWKKIPYVLVSNVWKLTTRNI